MVVGCTDVVPVAEGPMQRVLLGLSCKWHFPWGAALQLILGVLGQGRGGTEPVVV